MMVDVLEKTRDPGVMFERLRGRKERVELNEGKGRERGWAVSTSPPLALV